MDTLKQYHSGRNNQVEADARVRYFMASGMDHAGIATQNKVEEHLAAEGFPGMIWEGKSFLSGPGVKEKNTNVSCASCIN